jgi:hypothetical protein
MSRFMFVAALSCFAACGAPAEPSSPIEPVMAEVLQLPVPEGWSTVDSGCGFTFRAPSDMSKQHVLGFDSCVGTYVNPAITLNHDYGWYSVRFEGDKPELRETAVLIDGKYGKLTSFREDGRYIVAVYLPMVTEQNKLSMWAECQDAAAADTARVILSTIDFK